MGLFISNPWAKIRDMEKRAEGCGPGEELGKEEAEEGRGLFIRPLEAVQSALTSAFWSVALGFGGN